MSGTCNFRVRFGVYPARPDKHLMALAMFTNIAAN